MHGPRRSPKFRPSATSARRRRTSEVRPDSSVEKPTDRGRLGGKSGRPCSGCTARGAVRNSDPQRPQLAVGGRPKFGRIRVSKSRRTEVGKGRSDSKAMRTRRGGRLGGKSGRPCTPSTADRFSRRADLRGKCASPSNHFDPCRLLSAGFSTLESGRSSDVRGRRTEVAGGLNFGPRLG